MFTANVFFFTNPGSVPSIYCLSEEVRLGRQNQDLYATNLQQPVCFERNVMSPHFFLKEKQFFHLFFQQYLLWQYSIRLLQLKHD